MDFINLPRSRRLVPVSSLSWTGTFNAGYDPELEATAVELPYQDGEFSLILLLPGKISEFVTGKNISQQVYNISLQAVNCHSHSTAFYFSN